MASQDLRPGADGDHHTFCRLCEALCGLTVQVRAGEVVRIGPDRENPHSRGHLCLKGPAMAEVQRDRDRVVTPLRRVGGPGEFVPVSWDEALDGIAAQLNAILEDSGPEAVATYTGNPASYSTGLLYSQRHAFRALGLRKHFNPATQDTTSRVVANYCLYGSLEAGGIPDLEHCDLLLVFGANPLVSHGSMLITGRVREELDAVARRGEVVVFDPRRTETAERYSHVALRAGEDVWVLAALLGELFRTGRTDAGFLAAHVEGWRELGAAVGGVTPERAERFSGVAAETIRSLAARLASGRSAVYGRVGVCRGRFSTLSNFLIDAVNIVAGRFAEPGGWVFGYSPLASPPPSGPRGYSASRSRIAPLPTIGGVMPSLVMADEILEPGDGRVRALFVVAGNPLLSTAGGDRLDAALRSLDLMVSMDLYVNETNRHAHYVLPAATFLERADVTTLPLSNMLRPFLQYTPPVLEPRGEAREESAIYRDIAERTLRLRGEILKPYDGPFEAFDAALSAGPSGLTLETLRGYAHGVRIDASLLYEGWQARLGYPDGRIRLWHDLIAAEFARLDREREPGPDELRMIGRRELRSMNSWMHNIDRLARQQIPHLQMHPQDAAARGLVDGERVAVTGPGGRIIVLLKVTDAVRPGVVCYPHGWGHAGGWRMANSIAGGNVNALAPNAPSDAEEVSGSSFLDGFPVMVEGVEERRSTATAGENEFGPRPLRRSR